MLSQNDGVEILRDFRALSKRVKQLERTERLHWLDVHDRMTTHHHTFPPMDHFRATALDAMWSWAGAPFVTPTTVSLANSRLQLTGDTGKDRYFLHQSTINSSPKYLLASMTTGADGQEVGIRLDDGTDANYREWGLQHNVSSNMGIYTPTARERAASGTPTTVSGQPIQEPGGHILFMQITGTAWSSWDNSFWLRNVFSMSGGFLRSSHGFGSASWTPTRAGIYARWAEFGTGTWNTFNIDWFDT